MNCNCPICSEYKYFLTRKYPAPHRTLQGVTRSPGTITRRNQRKDKDSACSVLCHVVKPQKTHSMRLLEGLTVAHVL